MAVSLVGVSGRGLYHFVFILVGLTPVVYRTFQNFALEICTPEDHPRYLSTLGLCMAAPMFFSPLVGLLVDLVGFTVVFLGIAGLVLVGWLIHYCSFKARFARGDILPLSLRSSQTGLGEIPATHQPVY